MNIWDCFCILIAWSFNLLAWLSDGPDRYPRKQPAHTEGKMWHSKHPAWENITLGWLFILRANIRYEIDKLCGQTGTFLQQSVNDMILLYGDICLHCTMLWQLYYRYFLRLFVWGAGQKPVNVDFLFLFCSRSFDGYNSVVCRGYLTLLLFVLKYWNTI